MRAREMLAWVLVAFMAIGGTTAYLMREDVDGAAAGPDSTPGLDTAYQEPYPPPEDLRDLLEEANERWAECHEELTRSRMRLRRLGHRWNGERWVRTK